MTGQARRPCVVCGMPKSPGRARRWCDECRDSALSWRPTPAVAQHMRAYVARRTAVAPDTGCWVWNGKLCRWGYGRAKWLGREVQAHRLSYMAHRGVIATDLPLDHLCRVRACCNPAHLESVTHAENNRRRVLAVYGNNPTLACRHGHRRNAENTYRTSSGEVYCRPCNRAAAARSKARRLAKAEDL